jgi:hypothetical protein
MPRWLDEQVRQIRRLQRQELMWVFAAQIFLGDIAVPFVNLLDRSNPILLTVRKITAA